MTSSINLYATTFDFPVSKLNHISLNKHQILCDQSSFDIKDDILKFWRDTQDSFLRLDNKFVLVSKPDIRPTAD